ncbi:hypothetical protein ACFFLM_12715 [Deinococcus oregonensis]|uniref:Lipoprotein n=1 Tax=Deinococcus oregonensis TaxID=1805970 RepID=A0ABV6B1T2_9DEIO
MMYTKRFVPLLLLSLLVACGTPQPAYISVVDQIKAAKKEGGALAYSVEQSLSSSFTQQSLRPLDIPNSSKNALLKLRTDVIAKFPSIINQRVWLVETGQLVPSSEKSNVTKDMIGLFVLGTSDVDIRFRQVWVATITVNLRTQEILNTAIAPDLKTEYGATGDLYRTPDGASPLFRFLVTGDSGASENTVRQMSLGQIPAPLDAIGSAGFNSDGSERAPNLF